MICVCVCDFKRENHQSEICVCDLCVCVCDFGPENHKYEICVFVICVCDFRPIMMGWGPTGQVWGFFFFFFFKSVY